MKRIVCTSAVLLLLFFFSGCLTVQTKLEGTPTNKEETNFPGVVLEKVNPEPFQIDDNIFLSIENVYFFDKNIENSWFSQPQFDVDKKHCCYTANYRKGWELVIIDFFVENKRKESYSVGGTFNLTDDSGNVFDEMPFGDSIGLEIRKIGYDPVQPTDKVLQWEGFILPVNSTPKTLLYKISNWKGDKNVFEVTIQK